MNHEYFNEPPKNTRIIFNGILFNSNITPNQPYHSSHYKCYTYVLSVSFYTQIGNNSVK